MKSILSIAITAAYLTVVPATVASEQKQVARVVPPAWGNGYKWGWQANAVRKPNRLPETSKLLHNDNLYPTINRTYAMRLEAETGHLWPAVDRVLMPPPPKIKHEPLTTTAVHAQIKQPLVRNYESR